MYGDKLSTAVLLQPKMGPRCIDTAAFGLCSSSGRVIPSKQSYLHRTILHGLTSVGELTDLVAALLKGLVVVLMGLI